MYSLNAFLLLVTHVQLWAHFDTLFLTQQKTASPPTPQKAEFGPMPVSVTDARRCSQNLLERAFANLAQSHQNQWWFWYITI